MARAAGLVSCVFGALLCASCSPFGGGAFECTLDTQCGAAGKCSTGFCSFPDDHCDSGYRYGEASGPSSNQCVGGAPSDGSVTLDDTRVDTMVMSSDSSNCYGTGLVTACFASTPTGTKTLNADIDTATSALCDDDPRNAAWCVIAGASISVPGTVHVTGSKPLVLVATGMITVPGTLDASSLRVSGQVGAAANPAVCNAGTAPGTSGGGAGGSFGNKGGGGGGGMNAVSGGIAGNAVTPTALVGGCHGQDGNGANKGAGGNGGGAIYLIANTSISIGGSVTASGAGGGAGTMASSGGGGGGAGGFIGLDAPTVTTAGSIVANGGGGGEGSGTTTPGAPGADVTNIDPAPGGGGGSTNGGDGGDGAVAGSVTGQAGSAGAGGGGGGGGGFGIIRLDRATSIGGGGTVTPAPT